MMKRTLVLAIVVPVALAGILVGCQKVEPSSAELQQKATKFLQHLSNQEYGVAVEQFDR